MNKVIYIVEGETEQRFFEFLKARRYIKPGKIYRFNLMQQTLKQTSSICAAYYDRVYAVIDTDVADCAAVRRLQANYKTLLQVCRHTKILVQNKNFEDELRYLLGGRDLYAVYNGGHKSLKDLKAVLAQRPQHEKVINSSPDGYCTRYSEFCQQVKSSGVSLPAKVWGSWADIKDK